MHAQVAYVCRVYTLQRDAELAMGSHSKRRPARPIDNSGRQSLRVNWTPQRVIGELAKCQSYASYIPNRTIYEYHFKQLHTEMPNYVLKL